MEPFVRRYNLDNRRFALVVQTVRTDQPVSPQPSLIAFSYHRIDGVLVGALYGGAFVEGSLLGRFIAADRIEAVFHCLSATLSLASGRIEGVIGCGPEGRLTLSLDWQWLWGRTGRGAALFSEW